MSPLLLPREFTLTGKVNVLPSTKPSTVVSNLPQVCSPISDCTKLSCLVLNVASDKFENPREDSTGTNAACIVMDDVHCLGILWKYSYRCLGFYREPRRV
jgi:hypothetical protein